MKINSTWRFLLLFALVAYVFVAAAGAEFDSERNCESFASGRLEISGPKKVKAGSYQTFRIIYEVGEHGIDDLANMRLLLRTLTDCGHLQTDHPDQPNYMTGTTSGDAKIRLSYLTHGQPGGGVRPWETALVVQVYSGFLREGDKVFLTLGDGSQGSPGWRMQTFREPTYEIRGEINPFGTGIFEPLKDRLVFRIIPDAPAKAVAVAPSTVEKGKPFLIRVRAEDKFGNPVGAAKEVKHKGIEQPGFHRLETQDPETGLKCVTNPIEVTEGNVGTFLFWGDLHAQSEETVGTNTLEDYLDFAQNKACLDVFSNQGHGYQTAEQLWDHMEELLNKYYIPGKFVTFPGYEWSGNTAVGGDHNVYFKKEAHKISRSSRTLVQDEDCAAADSSTIEDLFRHYKGDKDVLIHAHAGGRWADIRRPEKDLSAAIEVHSNWGTFEWLLEDAFKRGMRVGIVANSDDFRGRPGASYPALDWAGGYGGLTGIYADKLERDSIWSALKSRTYYATTGTRIILDVLMNNKIPMGRMITADQAEELSIKVSGTAPLERIDVRNGMEVVHTLRPSMHNDGGNRVKILWNGASGRGRGRKFKWDGHLIISGNSIRTLSLVNFYGLQRDRFQCDENQARWASTTTGGNAGVILDLENMDSGTLEFKTEHLSFVTPIKDIDMQETKFRADHGMGTWVSVCRLPKVGVHDHRFTWKVKGLKKGDNPLYIYVVQEDGHRAWSSPIYAVKE